MPQNLGTNYKSSFDRKNEGKIIKTDIYIKPDIKDFGVISFDKGKEIIVKRKKLHLQYMKK
jgi:NTE family protein